MDEVDKLQLAALGQHHPAGAATLAEILEQLTTLTPQAQAQWRRELGGYARDVEQTPLDADDMDPTHYGRCWLALEAGGSGWDAWACGWRVRTPEGTVWACYFSGATPHEAARKALVVAGRWSLEGVRR